jgi:hypothetical protein
LYYLHNFYHVWRDILPTIFFTNFTAEQSTHSATYLQTIEAAKLYSYQPAQLETNQPTNFSPHKSS